MTRYKAYPCLVSDYYLYLNSIAEPWFSITLPLVAVIAKAFEGQWNSQRQLSNTRCAAQIQFILLRLTQQLMNAAHGSHVYTGSFCSTGLSCIFASSKYHPLDKCNLLWTISPQQMDVMAEHLRRWLRELWLGQESSLT